MSKMLKEYIESFKTLKYLNLAAGKMQIPEDIKAIYDNHQHKFSIFLDRDYYNDFSVKMSDIEEGYMTWIESNNPSSDYILTNEDMFRFMEKTIMKFNYVSMYRILEHISFSDVLRFIYMLSTITDPGAIIDVIVPDYKILAQMLITEELEDIKDEAHNILLTTELLNEPSCPHASIWTKDRMKYFWELEGRFMHLYTEERYKFDGRDIYLRSRIERCNE